MTNLDEFSRSVINDVELAELLYINPEREISDIPITNPEKYNAAIKSLYLDWNPLQKLEPLDISVNEFHKRNQQIWFMPQEYLDMDIAKWILDQCQDQNELQRAGQELLEYAERDLLPLLQYLKYLVDTMRKNNIVWGVGRGSSVASFVLYLIGVHRIHSLRNNLEFTEFMR
ncbi:hypothetical protein EB001_03580 [bacterium]|nr:hypothetical protein [bacterium]